MLTEDYIQRILYVGSRGFSRAGLLVLGFSVLNIVVSLYGTVLWALDSPGYIFRASNVTAADYQDQRSDNPPYIVQLSLDATQLNETEKRLPQIIGAELFNTGLNYSLTGKVDNRHPPEVVTPTRQRGVGARIWLDDEGLSVSPDTLFMLPDDSTIDGEVFPQNCYIFDNSSAVWNCTFSNVFGLSFVGELTGMPEIHWDDVTDQEADSRYIMPNRMDNIWFSYGGGGGSALMLQVFTVTKERRRHTFVEATQKFTMLTTAGTPFAEEEVSDLVKRTWSANETERADPLVGRIIDSMMNAQSQNVSYIFGANALNNDNKTTSQSSWGFYTVENNGTSAYSLISITTTNITLIRSETIAKAPEPYEKCERSNFQNEANGGKVTRTDCAGNKVAVGTPEFYGQVDTAAVIVAYGLGDGRSNISSKSLDNDILTWLWDKSDTIASLLTARAYTVSIDPSLVQITVDKLMVAMSRLQLALSCLALFLALVMWLGLMSMADNHWTSSLLANLANTTFQPNKPKPGWMTPTPDLTLMPGDQKKFLAVGGQIVTLWNPVPAPMQSVPSPAPYGDDGKGYMNTGAYPVAYNDPNAGRQGLLEGYDQNHPNTR